MDRICTMCFFLGNRTKIETKTRQLAATPVKTKQTTLHGLCGESSLSAQDHLKVDKQRKNKHTNKQKQAQVAAIAYNTTVDIDDLKPQDNTSTA